MAGCGDWSICNPWHESELACSDWAVWPSLCPLPNLRFSTGTDGYPLPVYSPKFATGHDLWRLGMPRAIRPDDLRLEAGTYGQLQAAGVPKVLGGIRYAGGRRGVTVEHVGHPNSPLEVFIGGRGVTVQLRCDEAGKSITSSKEVSKLLSENDDAEYLLGYAIPVDELAVIAPKIELPWSAGTLSIVDGAPCSTFTMIVECMRTGYLVMRPEEDRLAQFRVSLDGGKSWGQTRPYPDDAWEPESMGMMFRFGDGGVPGGVPPFQKGQKWVLETRESGQIDEALRAQAATMIRFIGCAFVAPLLKWEADLRQINATLAAAAILRGPRGMEAAGSGRLTGNYDEDLAKREKQARDDLADIAEQYQRLAVVASGDTWCVDSVSNGPPQGGAEMM